MEITILSIAAISGILMAIRFKGTFHKIISFGLTFSILLLWIDDAFVITASLIAITILAILTFIYGVTVKNLNQFEKINIISTGLALASILILKFLHLPGLRIAELLMVLSILLSLISFIKANS